MDANEDINNPKSHISQLFAETNLVNIHHYCYPMTHKPATQPKRKFIY